MDTYIAKALEECWKTGIGSIDVPIPTEDKTVYRIDLASMTQVRMYDDCQAKRPRPIRRIIVTAG